MAGQGGSEEDPQDIFSDDNVINSHNNVFQHIGLSKTFGILQYVQIVSYTIVTREKKLVFIHYNGGQTQTLRRIDSNINAGELLIVRANRIVGSGSNDITIEAMNGFNNGNIFLSAGITQERLAHGSIAVFVKIDNIVNGEPATYQLLSIR